MNHTSSCASFGAARISLPAPSSSSSSSSQSPADDAAVRRGAPGDRPMPSPYSPAREHEPDYRCLSQFSPRMPQPGELASESAGSPRPERKTDDDREIPHPARVPKRQREEAPEPASVPGSLVGVREPDKKARSQTRIDPQMQAFLERYPSTAQALDAAFARRSTPDDFLERVSQALRDRIGKSSSRAQAVQDVTRETLLALGRALPPKRSSYRYDDPERTINRSLGQSCTHLLRGLLRERNDSESPLCTRDLPGIVQGLESKAFYSRRADHSHKLEYYASLLKMAWTHRAEIPAELLAWVAVPSRYPAHIFGSRLTGEQLAARRNELALSMLSGVAEGEVFRDHMDFLASQGVTVVVAHATSEMADFHPDKASALLCRALARPDPTGDLCGQVAWGMGLNRAMREQRGGYWIDIRQVPSEPFFCFGGRSELMTKAVLTPIQSNLVTYLVMMVRDGQGAETRLIRLGWGLERAIDGNLRFGATLDPVDDSVKGILERYVGDPASPLTPAQRIAFVAGIAGAALARDPAPQALAPRFPTDDASCRDLIELGVQLANPRQFVNFLVGTVSTGPRRAWAALGRGQQDKLLASAFLAPAGSSLQGWQDTLVTALEVKTLSLSLFLDALTRLYRHAGTIEVSTFDRAQRFLLERLAPLADLLEAQGAQPEGSRDAQAQGQANSEIGDIFASLCALHQSFNEAHGWIEDPDQPNIPLPPSTHSQRASAQQLLKWMEKQIEVARQAQATLPPLAQDLYLRHLREARTSLQAALSASPAPTLGQPISSSSSSSSF